MMTRIIFNCEFITMQKNKYKKRKGKGKLQYDFIGNNINQQKKTEISLYAVGNMNSSNINI